MRSSFQRNAKRGVARQQFNAAARNPQRRLAPAFNKVRAGPKLTPIFNRSAGFKYKSARPSFNKARLSGSLRTTFNGKSGYPFARNVGRPRNYRGGENLRIYHSGAKPPVDRKGRIRSVYATPEKYSSSRVARQRLALSKYNRATHMTTISAPRGSRATPSRVLAANGRPGKGRQVRFDSRLPSSSILKTRIIKGGLSSIFRDSARKRKSPMEYFIP
jgi:hypothetical protein